MKLGWVLVFVFAAGADGEPEYRPVSAQFETLALCDEAGKRLVRAYRGEPGLQVFFDCLQATEDAN